MAEENQNEPNTPSTSESTQSETISDTTRQADLASQLNNSLNEVNSNLDRITGFTRTQSDLFVSLLDSFEKIHDAVEEMAASSAIITNNIEKAALIVLDKFSDKNFVTINKSLSDVANVATNGITSQSQAFKDLSNESENFQNANQSLTQQMSDNAGSLSNHQSQNQKEAEALGNAADQLNEGFDELAEQASKTSEEIQSLNSGFGGTIKSMMSGITGALGSLFNSMTALVGAAKNFVTFSLSIPFTITQSAAKLGNTIRTDLVEVIQTSVEAAKEKFDLSSHIGKGITSMGERGKKMLMDFQNPASEMVKIFGYGAAGIASRNSFLVESIASMGHFSELFGKSLTDNEKNLVRFTKLTKAFGFSGEDLKYLALDAANNLMHVNERMEVLGETITNISSEYGLDRKRLSKNVMALRKDITLFGHLSDEEITRTAAKITHMKVKLEDAAAVFKKFSTFEDAASSVAMLSQTFGMNLSAMDLIQAKKPEEIFTMFRESMLQTGRSFEDLNRHEKELMAQHTGMSAESLKALMNYRDLGYSYQDAVDKMNAEKPEAKQMEALKGLNSAIKEIQKVLQFTSPFQAFADGLLNNMTLTGSLKDTVTSLSEGYQGIYEYAKGLNPKVWRGIVEPIEMILSVMKQIFESKGFKKGLLGALRAVSNFVARVFGVTSEDVILENLRSNMTSILDNKKIDPKVKERFKKDVGSKMSTALSDHRAALSPHIANLDEMINKNDTIGIIEALQLIRTKSNIPEATKIIVKDLSRGLAEGLSTVGIKTKDGKVEKAYEGIAGQFAADIKRNLSYNAENAKKLGNLSSNVMGAIIMGAGTGFVAFLRILNDGIDHASDFMGQGKDKQVNRLAEFLKVDKSRLVDLGSSLNQAIRGLFDRKGKLFNIASWVVSGFGDMFEIIIDLFLHTLAGGLEGIFGDMFEYTPSARQMINLSKFDKKMQQEGGKNVLKGLSEGGEIKGKDAGASTHLAEAKIRTVKDRGHKTMLLDALDKSREDFIDSDGGARSSRKLASDMMTLMQNIQGDKYVGDVQTKKIGDRNVEYIEKNINKVNENFLNNFVNVLSGSLLGKNLKLHGMDFGAPLISNLTSDYNAMTAINSLRKGFDFENFKSHIDKIPKSINKSDNTQRALAAAKYTGTFDKENNSLIENLFKYFIQDSASVSENLIVTLLSTDSATGLANPNSNVVREKYNMFGDVDKKINKLTRKSLSDTFLTTPDSSKESLNGKLPAITPVQPVATTSSAPLPSKPAIDNNKNKSIPKKRQIDDKKENLKSIKASATNAKSIKPGNLVLTSADYVAFSKKLLSVGDLLGLSKLPYLSGASNIYLSENATNTRSGDQASDPAVSSQAITENNQVMNTEVR